MDLQRFCHPSSEYNIDKPFSRGKWTYATDGRIAIRVPRVEGYDQDKGPKNIEQMFSYAEKRGVAVWQGLPEFKLVVKECSWCGGRGHIKHCPAFGNPDIKCGNGDWKKCNRYNDDCTIGCAPSDKGAATCTECFGSGTEKVNDGPIMIGAEGKTKVNAIYLDMICDLPKVQIAPHDGTSFFRITFDGGEGILMPMRMELTELF